MIGGKSSSPIDVYVNLFGESLLGDYQRFILIFALSALAGCSPAIFSTLLQ